jgi:MtN3 and saliva related transmembrane protein
LAGFAVEAVGMAAAACTTLCWAPQALRILRTHDTRAISLAAQAVFAGGIALWLAYGLLIGSWPVTLANACTLLLVGAIVAMKIRYG